MRPAMYGAYHHITVMGKENSPCDHKYDIAGSLCENNDKFAVDRMLPEIEKDGSISNVLKVGQEVLVQIAKEPISTKGPRLTSELSFAGRYIVLIPFADKVFCLHQN